jgi:hypothetical protein
MRHTGDHRPFRALRRPVTNSAADHAVRATAKPQAAGQLSVRWCPVFLVVPHHQCRLPLLEFVQLICEGHDGQEDDQSGQGHEDGEFHAPDQGAMPTDQTAGGT